MLLGFLGGIALIMAESVFPSGKKIQTLRIESRTMTLTKMAEVAGISAQTLRKAERGEQISRVTLARIAKALGTTLDEITARSAKT